MKAMWKCLKTCIPSEGCLKCTGGWCSDSIICFQLNLDDITEGTAIFSPVYGSDSQRVSPASERLY